MVEFTILNFLLPFSAAFSTFFGRAIKKLFFLIFEPKIAKIGDFWPKIELKLDFGPY